MKKIFIVHGFEGSPNGGWRPWLMGELEKRGIYACALSMPSPEAPVLSEWIAEIERYVERDEDDEIYLVGHSLGASTILRYLEVSSAHIKGAMLVSGPYLPTNNEKIRSFVESPFQFELIRSKCPIFSVIHGDNDPAVPIKQAKELSAALDAELIIVPNGGHLNGSSGWTSLPPALEALGRMLAK